MNKQANPRFFTIEGIDGAGKDTLAKVFQLQAKQNPDLFSGREIFITKEPTLGTKTAEAIQEVFEKHKQGEALPSADILAKLYIYDRIQHTEKIRLELAKEKIVFSLRYDLSTYAYQSVFVKAENQEVFFEEVYQNHLYEKQGGTLIPKISFYLDISVTESMKRLHQRQRETELLGDVSNTTAQDFYEEEKFLQQVAAQYKAAMVFLKKKDAREILSFDASLPKHAVFQNMLQHF